LGRNRLRHGVRHAGQRADARQRQKIAPVHADRRLR
jgi:hypothetical protein